MSALKVYGKQVMYRRRDDKTEVKSLVLPETKKVAMLLANLANMSKRTFCTKAERTLSSSFLCLYRRAPPC